MPISQFVSSLLFYLIFSLFVLIGLPLTMRLFSNKILAFIAAKPAGLLIFGYVIWLLSSLKLLDYQNQGLILTLFLSVILACAVASYKFFKTDFPFRQLMMVEGFALLVYLAYLFVRANNSAINGTERFMDLALLSASGKTHFFPFLDPWFAGKTVNYYYYGSYLVSLLSNLGKLPYVLTYNFALGLLYCETALLTAALTWTLTASKKIALLAAFLVTSAGTLFFAGCTLHANFATPAGVCSYASSTRLFTPSYIINEIPSYSFTVGDLHAHLLGLPFFLFNLILLYHLAGSKKIRTSLVFLLALGLASSGMINAWDAVTLSAILAVIILVKIIYRIWEKGKSNALGLLKPWLVNGAAIIVLAFLLMWPNLRNFQSPVIGIGFAPSFVSLHQLMNVQYPTPIQAELGMWGIFTAGIILAVVYAWRNGWKDYLFLFALGIVGAGIIFGVELLFVKDIYSVANPSYFRANTTFKFGYHAWVILSIAFAAAIAALSRVQKPGFWTLSAGISVIAVVAGLVYPYQAIKQFYGADSFGNPITLDGGDWMRQSALPDWRTVNFVNQNIPDRAVIAEAVGDSYTTFSRIATYTGMIAPMGWQTHEWTWRFQGKNAQNASPGKVVETGWGPVAQVASDMALLYQTDNASEALRIVRLYDISYIYVGNLEKQAYDGLNEEKFKQLGLVIYESGDSRLYIINPNL